ncbi:MAG: M20/M25/M40 family metallo-hydrolase, partial [Myxococcota bacterium]
NAHKGVVHARIVARGRACHSSDPLSGSNAIVTLARAILAIEQGARLLPKRPHPQLGAATLSIGVIHGGQAPNIVPDRAEIWVDRRTLPDESAEAVRRLLEADLVEAGLAEAVVVESCTEEKPPLETDPSSIAVQSAAAALGSVGLSAACDQVAFGTDAGVFGRAGIPGVVLGPGSLDVAHTSREYVPISEVETMARIFERLLETTARPP